MARRPPRVRRARLKVRTRSSAYIVVFEPIELQAEFTPEAMIDMANNFFITKVSRVFCCVSAYTPAVEKGLPELFISKVIPTAVAAALLALLAPAGPAQVQSTTRIVPVPDGATYSVDGQNYQHTTSFIWPQGSKHTLQAPNLGYPAFNTQVMFQNWQWSGDNSQVTRPISQPIRPLLSTPRISCCNTQSLWSFPTAEAPVPASRRGRSTSTARP